MSKFIASGNWISDPLPHPLWYMEKKLVKKGIRKKGTNFEECDIKVTGKNVSCNKGILSGLKFA